MFTRKWGKDSHDFFFKLWQSADATEAGISLIPVTRITNNPQGYDKRWKEIPFECKDLDAKSIEVFSKHYNRDYK